ncbi:hypothetical protein CDAR_526191 [Caerostris darwini]|uniref:Uncharacterized protein n=1 Tax=Caerostris darwini TaxID=1538125 RepID=A0AAV4UHW0_9ARAC|nr:hypothetical protein CDAR_526191 [Caerostris darwini]
MKIGVSPELASLGEPCSACIIVDITGEQYTPRDRLANKWLFRHQTKLPFPYRGEYNLEQARTVIKRLHDEKDAGLGQFVAVKGDAHKDFFFKSCRLPKCVMKSEMLGDCSKCSKRMAYTLAHYLERRGCRYYMKNHWT